MTQTRYHELMHRSYRAVRARITRRAPDHPDLPFIVLEAFRHEVKKMQLEPPVEAELLDAVDSVATEEAA